MDALEPLLAACLSRIAEGSLGAAGAQLWEELRKLIGQGKVDEEQEDLLPVDPRNADPKALAALLVDRAAGDPPLLTALEDWQARVGILQSGGDVSNSVSGEVHGDVVQAQNIGSLRIG